MVFLFCFSFFQETGTAGGRPELMSESIDQTSASATLKRLKVKQCTRDRSGLK